MNLRALMVLPLLVLLGACNAGTDDTTDTDTDTDTVVPGAALGGVWKATSETNVFLGSEGLTDVAYVQFDETVAGGGFLWFYGEEAESGRLLCDDALFSVVADGVLDVSLASTQGTTYAYLFERTGDTLTVWNATGEQQTFSAVAEVPAESVCGTVTVEQDATLAVEVNSFGNLLYDGTDLRLPSDDGSVYALDLGTRTASDPLPYNALYDDLVTMQGTDGWAHCGCGGSEEIVRATTAGATVDTVDTNALGHEISVRGAAWDGMNLWLTGYSYDEASHRLLKVDSEAEPDVVVSDVEVAWYAKAMVARGPALYALVGASIVEVNKTTGRAEGTWLLPRLGGWTPFGLTSDGTSLYVGADDSFGSTRVLRFQLD